MIFVGLGSFRSIHSPSIRRRKVFCGWKFYEIVGFGLFVGFDWREKCLSHSKTSQTHDWDQRLTHTKQPTRPKQLFERSKMRMNTRVRQNGARNVPHKAVSRTLSSRSFLDKPKFWLQLLVKNRPHMSGNVKNKPQLASAGLKRSRQPARLKQRRNSRAPAREGADRCQIGPGGLSNLCIETNI